MSHGGPQVAYRRPDGTVYANCPEDSDVCQYGEHRKCSGQVEHLRRLDIIDEETGDVVGTTARYRETHMCNCRCHWEGAR